MRRSVGALSVAVLVATLLAPAANAQDASTSLTGVAVKAFDAALVRPLCFVGMLVGGVLFVPAALITLPNGRDSVGEARGVFVDPYYHNVFERPLGDF